MLNINVEDKFNIKKKDKETHILRTVLKFSQVKIPIIKLQRNVYYY